MSDADRVPLASSTHLRKVVGFCPMGCGATLVYFASREVRCFAVNCPRPGAVSEILADRETEHIVQFDESTFTVRHPLRERLDDALMTCDLHEWCFNLDGPPTELGRYRAMLVDGTEWEFSRVEDGEV